MVGGLAKVLSGGAKMDTTGRKQPVFPLYHFEKSGASRLL